MTLHPKSQREQESVASLTSEITSITANIDTLKADLKLRNKCALKKAEKEVASLEAKKGKADAKAAEEAKKAEAEAVLKKAAGQRRECRRILVKTKIIFLNLRPCGCGCKSHPYRFYIEQNIPISHFIPQNHFR